MNDHNASHDANVAYYGGNSLTDTTLGPFVAVPHLAEERCCHDENGYAT